MHPTVVMGMHLARKVAPIVFRHSPVSQHRHALICPDLGCGRPEDDREMAEEILLAAAARGMVLADLAGLAGEMYERSRSGQPDEDMDGPFGGRAVKLATTFGGAGVLHGDLTPGCATIVETVLDALSVPAGAGDTRTHEQRYHDALQEATAPRGAALYRPRSGQEWEELFLDLMADLDLKGEGDNSMPGNRQLMPRRTGWRAGRSARYGESVIA
jgi:Domain of unknown function (DUF222)